jgi:uroporphyrinogen decarboxylase
MKLSRGLAVEQLRAHPQELHAALGVITEVTRAMTEASLAAGADGLFFASQCADFRVMDEAEYREFGLHYDLEVLAGAGASRITMLHLHGEAPMFDLQTRYPAHAINWHDRHAPPDLVEGIRESGRCAAGGINERTIATATPEAAAAEALDAVARTGGRHLIVTAGCVIPVATPGATIRAVVETVQSG